MTLAFVVIPESSSRESVFCRFCFLAKTQEPRQKHSGMTLAFAVIPESRSRESVFAVVVPFRNDRSWTTTFQDDDNNNAKAKQHNR